MTESIIAQNPAGFEGIEITLGDTSLEAQFAVMVEGIVAWYEEDKDKAMTCWVASRMIADRMTPEQLQAGLEQVQGWQRIEEDPDHYESEDDNE